MLVKKITQFINSNGYGDEPRKVITYYFLGIPFRRDVEWGYLSPDEDWLETVSDKAPKLPVL